MIYVLAYDWIWNGEENLFVKYGTHDPWCLLRTELNVGDELMDIPQNVNSAPKIGEFEFQTYYTTVP